VTTVTVFNSHIGKENSIVVEYYREK